MGFRGLGKSIFPSIHHLLIPLLIGCAWLVPGVAAGLLTEGQKVAVTVSWPDNAVEGDGLNLFLMDDDKRERFWRGENTGKEAFGGMLRSRGSIRFPETTTELTVRFAGEVANPTVTARYTGKNPALYVQPSEREDPADGSVAFKLVVGSGQNLKGRLQCGGEPIPNAIVIAEIEQENGETARRLDKVNGKGDFRLGGVPNGTIALSFSKPDVPGLGDIYILPKSAGQAINATIDIDVLRAHPEGLGGVTILMRPAFKLKDPYGHEVRFASVKLVDADGRQTSLASSDNHGVVRLPKTAPSGRYTLKGKAALGTSTIEFSEPVEVTDSDQVQEITLPLHLVTVRGAWAASYRTTARQITDSGKQPLISMKVGDELLIAVPGQGQYEIELVSPERESPVQFTATVGDESFVWDVGDLPSP